MTREFEDFAEKAQVSNEEIGLNSGVIWYSHRANGPAGSYDAFLPAGLHISCGIANIRTQADGFGGFEAAGPVMNVLYTPDDSVCFRTEVGSGAVSSFGYFVPAGALEDDDGVIAGIAQIAKGAPLIPIAGKALRSVPRLVTSVSNEFCGKDLEMMYQSRALELSAMVSSLLQGRYGRVKSSRLQRKMQEVVDGIEAGLAIPVTLDDLAKRHGMSARVLTTAFRNTFGESVAEFLIRRRMEEAAALLEAGALVATAANTVGYSPNAFSTAFARYYGFPPSKLLNHKRRSA